MAKFINTSEPSGCHLIFVLTFNTITNSSVDCLHDYALSTRAKDIKIIVNNFLFRVKKGIFVRSTKNTGIMLNYILLFALGTGEIILIALVVLLIFGGKKIPELMRGLGKGVSQFKKGIKDIDEEINDTTGDNKLK